MSKRCIPGVLLFWLWSICTQAQVSITTPYPVAAQSLSSGLDQTLLTVDVQFAAACAGSTVSISFPAAIDYVPGSISLVSGASYPGATIAESNIVNTNKPDFTITVPSAGSVRFTLLRRAGCSAPVNGKDTVRVSGGCGSATENSVLNSYTILSPVLSMVAPAAISNAVLGQTVNRTITVNNGGNGCTDTLRLYLVYPSGGLVNTNSNKLSVGGTDFSPWRISGDTLFYKFYGATLFGGDSLYCNGESVVISELIKVLKCNTTTSYNASWGRDQSNICNAVSSTSAMAMASGTANFSASPITTNVGFSDLCTPWTQTASFTNSGSGNAVAASMYNVQVSIEGEAGGNIGSNLSFLFSAFNVNGQALVTSGSNSTTYTIDLNNRFSSDPDGA